MRYHFILDLVPMSTNRANIIVVNKRTGRGMIMKNAEAKEWMRCAVSKLAFMKMERRLPTIECEVSLTMHVWRERRSGDLDNYYKGVCDALQEAGIVRNDKLITVHRDCRVLVDPSNPRYEILLEPLEGGVQPLFPLT